MMAAATIVENDPQADVCLVEKNSMLGCKVLLSGGGRCNLTTTDDDIPLLMKSYPRGERWLRFAMHEFSPANVYEWFEKHRIPLKAEGKKIYPISDKGKDVTKMFQRIFTKNKVDVLLKTEVTSVQRNGDEFQVHFSNGDSRICDKLILTTGGSAYSQTGSTGDGYAFAKAFGHIVSPLAATLTSFFADEAWVSKLSGVSIEKAKLKIIGKNNHEVTGSLLFTHKGVSGPGIFAISSLSAFEECSEEHPLPLSVDFVPDFNPQALAEEISRKVKENPKKTFTNILNNYAPKSLLTIILEKLNLDGSKITSEVSKKDINKAIEALKNTKITLNARTPGAEIVTAGGVNLKEVDTKTMESKLQPGLYFGGELMDVDGFTGGYNLQIAWATGRLAGKSAGTQVDGDST